MHQGWNPGFSLPEPGERVPWCHAVEISVYKLNVCKTSHILPLSLNVLNSCLETHAAALGAICHVS